MRVSIEGNIGAGKSAALDALAARGFAVHKEPVDEWAEMLELFYKAPAEWALPFSLKVLLSFDRIAAGVVERSPQSCHHVFTQLLYNEGKMSYVQWDLFREYVDALGWTPDAIVYIDTPTDVCLDRVRTRNRQGEGPIDLAYLKRVEFQYETMLKYVGVPVVRVDGTLSSVELADAVEREVRKFLNTSTTHSATGSN